MYSPARTPYLAQHSGKITRGMAGRGRRAGKSGSPVFETSGETQRRPAGREVDVKSVDSTKILWAGMQSAVKHECCNSITFTCLTCWPHLTALDVVSVFPVTQAFSARKKVNNGGFRATRNH